MTRRPGIKSGYECTYVKWSREYQAENSGAKKQTLGNLTTSVHRYCTTVLIVPSSEVRRSPTTFVRRTNGGVTSISLYGRTDTTQ